MPLPALLHRARSASCPPQEAPFPQNAATGGAIHPQKTTRRSTHGADYLKAARGLKERPRLLTTAADGPIQPSVATGPATLRKSLPKLKAGACLLGVQAGEACFRIISPTYMMLAAAIFVLSGSLVPSAVACAVFFCHELILAMYRHHEQNSAKLQAPLVDIPAAIETWMKLIKERKRVVTIYPEARPSCNAILYGPTGVGKTASLRTLCTKHGYKLTEVSSSDIKSKWSGEGAKNIVRVFQTARLDATVTRRPVILFFDEIDTIFGPARDAAEGSGIAQHNSELMGELLKKMEEIDSKNANVFVVASTNRHHVLDPAMASRFSTSITFETPSIRQRAHFFSDRLATYKHKMSFDEQIQLVLATDNMSYRELDRTVLLGGAHAALAQNRDHVLAADVMAVAEQWQTEQLARKPRAQMRDF